MIKGMDVTLYQRIQTGTDSFGAPLYEETPEVVSNVLVAPASEQEVLDTLNLTGRKAVYTLAIPKGDSHVWEDRKIEFFNQTWHSVGMAVEGMESMMPLSWNRKVRVERFE